MDRHGNREGGEGITKSENEIRQRLVHLMDLFEKEDNNPVRDMIMVCVQRELIWVLDKNKKADDHFG